MRTLAFDAMSGTVSFQKNLSATLAEAIVKIDEQIAGQLQAVTEADAFRSLHESWQAVGSLFDRYEFANGARLTLTDFSDETLGSAAPPFSLDAFLAAPPLDRARAVEDGLPARAVRDLVADPAISLADVASIVARRRTLDRRLADDEPLTPEESDRFARFVTLLDLASRLFGGRGPAMAWLGEAKMRFAGRRPLDLLRTDAGSRLVEDVLEQARYGFAA